MINRVFSDLPGFKEVSFESGLNVVLADRTLESTKKDTRNGLGKSTLIAIIHFVLGSKFSSDNPLRHPELHGVTFGLDLTILGSKITVTRDTRAPNHVLVTGDLPFSSSPGSPSPKQLSMAQWTETLGLGWFGLPSESDRKYRPTFRSAISYVARSSKDAYSSPFRTHRLQATWDIQVHNAYLLGLAWEDASDWQRLRDRKKLLDDLKNAAQSGVIQDVFGSRGQLEAERVRLKEAVARTAADLKAFRVHSSYASIERQADELTNGIKQASNDNTVDQKLLELYRSNMQEEVKAYTASVQGVYESARVVFPDTVKKHLSEVEQFHSVIVQHRRQFLLTEIDRLETEIANRNARLAEITSEHARLLQVLNTYGALEQFTRMQEAHTSDVAKLRDIDTRLKNIRDFEEGRNNLKIELAMLEKRARANYEARQTEREAAVAIFNGNSQALYNAPGRLMIDVGESGFSFDVQIQRKGSTGISNMEIFCYDLMLAERWNPRDTKPGFLLHDSNIFADVDDRQIALAMELAELKSRMLGFQYICTFNTDKLPLTEFSHGFSVDRFTRLRLTDKDETGGLLGRRLSSDALSQAKKKPERARSATAN